MSLEFETTPVTGGVGTSTPGVYSNESDLDDRWGTSNITAWSQLEPDNQDRDYDRISKALAWADEQVNDAFRGGPYPIPLQRGKTVVEWAATIAGFWLYRSRGLGDGEKGKEIKADFENTVATMALYRASVKRLESPRVNSSTTAPTIIS